MRRIFRDTTALAVVLSLVLPTVSSAQSGIAPAADADASAPERLILAQAGGNPVVVVPGGPAQADPQAKDKASAKAKADRADKQDKAGKQDKAAPADPARAAIAEAARAAAADKARDAEPKKAAPAANAQAEKAKAEKAKAAEAAAARQEAAAQQKARDAADAKAAAAADAKASAAAEARAQAAEDKAAEKAAAARKTAADNAAKAEAEAEAKARQAEAKARQAEARADRDAAARAASGKEVSGKDAASAPVVVTPGKAAAPKVAPAKERSPEDIARALAERQNPAAPKADAKNAGSAPVIVPGDLGKTANKAKPRQPERQPSPEDIARTLAERQGNGPTITPAEPPSDKGPVVVTGPRANDPAERAALNEARAAAGAVPELKARKTDAAIEAAAASAVPAAAALNGGAAPVVVSDKTKVTRENSRDATEDFSTDLSGRARDALNDAAAAAAAGKGRVVTDGGRPRDGADPIVVGGRNPDDRRDRDRRQADKDDDSDLEHALKGVVLPALAGMVVGKVLSNNRSVALNTGDRVVVTRRDGSQELIKDDNALLMRPGSTVQSEQFADGSTRTIVTREDGSQVVTIRDADLRVLRRSVVHPDGRVTPLIDETAAVRPVDVASLPAPARPVTVLPNEPVSDEALREALRRETAVGRTFTLGQIRSIPEVRALVAPVDIQSITFDTGSAAIKSDQAQSLASLGRVIAESVRDNPSEVYLIEGHTDLVGSDAANLALSDRRAESVALALTEFFQVPPENMVVQGYGEQFPKISREGDVRANRRATVRRITDLLARN